MGTRWGTEGYLREEASRCCDKLDNLPIRARFRTSDGGGKRTIWARKFRRTCGHSVLGLRSKGRLAPRSICIEWLEEDRCLFCESEYVSYNAQVKWSSSCFSVDCNSRSASCDIIRVVWSSFLETDRIRSSSWSDRSFRSFSLSASRFSRFSSSALVVVVVVVRLNRRQSSEPEAVVAAANCIDSSPPLDALSSSISCFLLLFCCSLLMTALPSDDNLRFLLVPDDDGVAWETLKALLAAELKW